MLDKIDYSADVKVAGYSNSLAGGSTRVAGDVDRSTRSDVEPSLLAWELVRALSDVQELN